jgi:hypothetical protein
MITGCKVTGVKNGIKYREGRRPPKTASDVQEARVEGWSLVLYTSSTSYSAPELFLGIQSAKIAKFKCRESSDHFLIWV